VQLRVAEKRRLGADFLQVGLKTCFCAMSIFQRPQLLGNKPTSVLCQSFDHIRLFGLNGCLRNSAATSSSSGNARAKRF
jgi:hypothetical protein